MVKYYSFLRKKNVSEYVLLKIFLLMMATYLKFKNMFKTSKNSENFAEIGFMPLVINYGKSHQDNY